MTLTIPTGDFIGVLGDALPFADISKKSTYHVVRMWWDGAQLHAEAFSGLHWGRSTWDPADDRTDDKDPQDREASVMSKWGGGDEPWSVVMSLPDAKELVRNYKLTGKGVYYVPLHLDRLERSLRVLRAKADRYSAITTVVNDEFTVWPNVTAAMELKRTRTGFLDGLKVSGRRMADFGAVRQVGPMELKFGEVGEPVHVTIGDRFVGAVMPWRESERIAAVDSDEDDDDDQLAI